MLYSVVVFLPQVRVGGEKCLMTVCGGGAWETVLAQQLQEHVNTNKIERFVYTIADFGAAINVYSRIYLPFLYRRESVLWNAIKALQRVSNHLYYIP